MRGSAGIAYSARESAPYLTHEEDGAFLETRLVPGLVLRPKDSRQRLPEREMEETGAGENVVEARADDAALDRLAEPMRQWVRAAGWPELHGVQKRAVGPVLAGDRDVLISAGTASGKTEAAFLPALSRVLFDGVEERPGVRVLYLCPLKALINDQEPRLRSLAGAAGLRVCAWHGDQSREDKAAFLDHPSGLLLITPESLEHILLRHGHWCYGAFAHLACVVVDEFHSFVGNERGVQLLSQLCRLETMLHRRVPRLALSATMGDPAAMAGELRPHRGDYPCALVRDDGASDTYLQLHAYWRYPPFIRKTSDGEKELVRLMYGFLLNGHNLVFTNSRGRTEKLANALSALCAQDGIPNQFFPHHGSLARNLRANLERRLQRSDVPTTAVCTMTLELGIDIGDMDSVSQLDAPSSVASLSQRLGRAGRRGDRRVFRLFLLENFLLRNAPAADRLHLGLFQSLAVLELLASHWCEPVESPRLHCSTLVQQILSLLAQYGGLRPSHLWKTLCESGPFTLGAGDFSRLLAGMSTAGLISRDADTKEARLEPRGQSLVDAADFGVAFSTPVNFVLECGGEVVGNLPLAEPLEKDARILFAGRPWTVVSIDEGRRRVQLRPDNEGTPPTFSGVGQPVHDRVRATMREIYANGREPRFANVLARKMFREGKLAFMDLGLHRSPLVYNGGVHHHLVPWRGDRFCRTLARFVTLAGFQADVTGGIVDIRCDNTARLLGALERFVVRGKPTPGDLVRGMPEELQEKYSFCVPADLLFRDNAARFYDPDAAWDWLVDFLENR